MDPNNHYLYDSENQPTISHSYKSILSEPIVLLEDNQEKLITKWISLYLSTFGRKPYFSQERVRKIFEEFVSHFLTCLRSSQLDRYFEMLKQKGELFAKLDVPFQEVILSIQLFEEAYLSIILENKQLVKHDVNEILMAFEELNSVSSSVFAVSYFKAAKSDWHSKCRGYQEENERLRSELRTLNDEFFVTSKDRLKSMELLVSGINKRLRKSVVQSRRIQILSELLEKESNLRTQFKIADKFFKQILPDDSEVIFGLFDENQVKLTLYSNLPSKDTEENPSMVLDDIYFSQVPANYQHVLFNQQKGYITFTGIDKMPGFLSEINPLMYLDDFLFLPLVKYGNPIGFVFIAAPEKNAFTKLNIKYYQRLARVFGNAIFSQMYFNRHKKHSEFVSIMDQLDERVMQREPMETTIDFCLEAIIKLLDVERASVMLYDKQDKTLSIYAAKGYKVFPFSGTVLKFGEGIAGWSLKESKIIAIPRMRNDKKASFFHRRVSATNDAQHLDVKSLLCVPLVHAGQGVGVINLSTISYFKHFEQSEINMINQFAQRIAWALTNLASIKDFESYIRSALRAS